MAGLVSEPEGQVAGLGAYSAASRAAMAGWFGGVGVAVVVREFRVNRMSEMGRAIVAMFFFDMLEGSGRRKMKEREGKKRGFWVDSMNVNSNSCDTFVK